jgi:hypothetical protein
MKLTFRSTFFLIFLFTITMGYAQADDFVRKYSFTTLDTLWQNLIMRDNAPNPDWYGQALLDQPTVLESKKDVVQERIANDWNILNHAVHKNTEKSGYFYVMKLPDEWIAAIVHREVTLNMYLNRETDYEAASPQPQRDKFQDDFQWQESVLDHQVALAKLQNTLTDRKVQAHLELFLINLIRYREAPTLAAKCKYLKRATNNLLVWQQDSGFSQASPQELLDIVEQARVQYNKDLTEHQVCKVEPNSTKHDVSKTIEETANEKIIQKLKNQQKSLVGAIAKQQEDLTKKQQETTVPTKTSDLLKLEMDMANASANLEFVHQDAIQLEENIIQKLEPKNFAEILSKIADNFVPEPVSRVNRQNALLQQKILALMEMLEQISEVASDKSQVEACHTLSKLFKNLFKNNELSATVAKDNALVKMNQCITASQQYIQKLKQPHPLEEQGIEFAKYLKQLSDAMLQRINTAD